MPKKSHYFLVFVKHLKCKKNHLTVTLFFKPLNSSCKFTLCDEVSDHGRREMFKARINQTTDPGKWQMSCCCFVLGKLVSEYICTYLFSVFINLKFLTSLLPLFKQVAIFVLFL